MRLLYSIKPLVSLDLIATIMHPNWIHSNTFVWQQHSQVFTSFYLSLSNIYMHLWCGPPFPISFLPAPWWVVHGAIRPVLFLSTYPFQRLINPCTPETWTKMGSRCNTGIYYPYPGVPFPTPPPPGPCLKAWCMHRLPPEWSFFIWSCLLHQRKYTFIYLSTFCIN
jgi:hypothetical protein